MNRGAEQRNQNREQDVEGSRDRGRHRVGHLDLDAIDLRQLAEQLRVDDGADHADEQPLSAQDARYQSRHRRSIGTRYDVGNHADVCCDAHDARDMLGDFVSAGEIGRYQENDRNRHKRHRAVIQKRERRTESRQ